MTEKEDLMRGAVLFGAIHLVVENGDCMDNIPGSQMGCDDDSRKPIPVQLNQMKP